MYEVRKTGQFKRDIKLCNKRNYDLSLLFAATQILENTGTLPEKYRPHKLTGKSNGNETWDGHIQPDWILLWRVEESEDENFEGIIIFVRTGTHSDLF
jgi:mRNA interferase YafQ